MTSLVDLIVFDCDGVIADSEVLATDVLIDDLKVIGMPITRDEVQRDFLGQSFQSMAAKLEQRFGRPLPTDFADSYREHLLQRFETDLRPTPGFPDMLRGIVRPVCVATSSAPPRVERTLDLLGLRDLFGKNVFTASQVKNGKPAPDLFLFAAAQMQTDPANSLVIEDSPAGVTAAQAAGMRVLHYRGGSHRPASIAGVQSFGDWRDFPQLLAQIDAGA
ncbi:HAD family hydrolase [Paracoccus sp. 11-3]|uniref:HAD family hydrolase n=1 Tax=Paracoccus amoyensis TaxID=2760093 RepID=A0A926GE40_9RHOB|nr:HAD family hydrolase [Paracoccus amoyensis]MBC9245674.1 HAD family hydrolase [Paracoccus amoyensis]